MNKKKLLVSNTLLIAAGSLSVQLASFLLLPFYTTYLTTSDYGIVDLVLAYTTLLAPLATLQLDMAVFRFLIDARGDKNETARIISSSLQAVGLFMLLFLTIFIGTVSLLPLAYAPIVLLTVCATALSNLFLQFARGMGNNRAFAIGGVISGFASIILSIIFITVLHMGAMGVLLAGAAGGLICTAYLSLAMKIHRYIDFRRSDKSLRKELLSYSLPLLPNGISWWVINASDRTIITVFLGVSANGVYAVAYKFPTLFGTIFSFFNMSWTESAAMHIKSGDRDRFFSDVSNASVRFFGSLAALIIAGLPLIFGFFVNDKYHEAYLYTPILMLAAFCNAMVGSYSAIYIAMKKTRQVASTSIFAAIINLILSLALIRIIGLYATALATAVAYMTMAIYRHYDTRKYVKLSYEISGFLKTIALFAFAVLLYYINQPALNVINVIITSVVAVLLNWSLIKQAKQALTNRAKKFLASAYTA